MGSQLASFLEQLRLQRQPPSITEPEVDLRDLGLEESDAAKFRQELAA